MDVSRVDILLQYALAVASEQDWDKRELGAIHLIKFVYLADLAHAEANKGKTFTGTPWRFYHFGPWAEGVYQRIQPALLAINAEMKTYESRKYDKDAERWSVRGYGLADRLEQKIGSFFASTTISAAVAKYGSDTEKLLHDVYATIPMLHAAPDELLDFSLAVKQLKPVEKKPIQSQHSVGQMKRRNNKLTSAKRILVDRLQKRREKKSQKCATPPRYDEVFMRGVEALDMLAGAPIQSSSVTCLISDETWKSKARHDPDLP